MPLEEQMYSTQQIKIPPKLPYILKKYAKAAIRTQPYDLLRWSMEYFKALAEGYVPPVKCRFEHPVFATQGGLTRGFLKVLVNQLAGVNPIPRDVLEAKWLAACLDYEELKLILCIIESYNTDTIDKLRFFAAAGSLLTQNLKMTMVLLCESLTKEPEGSSARIAKDEFLQMYQFLADFDGSRKWRYLEGVREDLLDLKFKSISQGSVEVLTPPEEESLLEEDNISEEFVELPEIVLTEAQVIAPEEEEQMSEAPDTRSIASGKSGMSAKSGGKDEESGDLAVEVTGEGDEELEVRERYEKDKRKRIADVTQTLDDLVEIVRLGKAAHYDLGMIAGRQMSMTSAEFVADAIQADILEMVGRQIDDLPPPKLRRIKITDCEKEGIAGMVWDVMNDIIDNQLPDAESTISSERQDITVVPPIPGIGPVVPEEMKAVFIAFCDEVALKQEDTLMPRNLRHFLCPPLEILKAKTPESSTDDVNEKKAGIDTAKIMPVIKNKIKEDVKKRFSNGNWEPFVDTSNADFNRDENIESSAQNDELIETASKESIEEVNSKTAAKLDDKNTEIENVIELTAKETLNDVLEESIKQVQDHSRNEAELKSVDSTSEKLRCNNSSENESEDKQNAGEDIKNQAEMFKYADDSKDKESPDEGNYSGAETAEVSEHSRTPESFIDQVLSKDIVNMNQDAEKMDDGIENKVKIAENDEKTSQVNLNDNVNDSDEFEQIKNDSQFVESKSDKVENNNAVIKTQGDNDKQVAIVERNIEHSEESNKTMNRNAEKESHENENEIEIRETSVQDMTDDRKIENIDETSFSAEDLKRENDIIDVEVDEIIKKTVNIDQKIIEDFISSEKMISTEINEPICVKKVIEKQKSDVTENQETIILPSETEKVQEEKQEIKIEQAVEEARFAQ